MLPSLEAETEGHPERWPPALSSAPHTPTDLCTAFTCRATLCKAQACPANPQEWRSWPSLTPAPAPFTGEPTTGCLGPHGEEKAACVSCPGERSAGSGHVRVAESWDRGRPAGEGPGDGEQQAFAVGVYLCAKCSGARQGPGWELGQDLRWPLISRSGCLGPSVLTWSTGPQRADLEHRWSQAAWTGSWLVLTVEGVPGPGAGGARRVVTEDPDCRQGPSLKNKGASAEGR